MVKIHMSQLTSLLVAPFGRAAGDFRRQMLGVEQT